MRLNGYRHQGPGANQRQGKAVKREISIVKWEDLEQPVTHDLLDTNLVVDAQNPLSFLCLVSTKLFEMRYQGMELGLML